MMLRVVWFSQLFFFSCCLKLRYPYLFDLLCVCVCVCVLCVALFLGLFPATTSEQLAENLLAHSTSGE